MFWYIYLGIGILFYLLCIACYHYGKQGVLGKEVQDLADKIPEQNNFEIFITCISMIAFWPFYIINLIVNEVKGK